MGWGGLFLTALFCFGSGIAHAAAPELHVRCGIGGLYRLGTWIPITVQLSNADTETASAQLQIVQTPVSGLGAAFYERPITLAPTRLPQTFTLITRDLDPVRDEASVRIQTDDHSVAKSMLADATGASVGEGDLLLVGLGGDASAFSFLDGQSWNLMHAPGGPNKSVTMPGMPKPQVRIASATLLELPDRDVGYSGVDAFLLRSDAPLGSLTETQAVALKSWVASGGELIICAGSDVSRFDDPFFSDLLPADVGSTNTSVTLPEIGTVSCVKLTPKSTQGAQVLSQTPTGHVLAVSSSYGAGRVVLTAVDPTTLPFRSWHGAREQAFWQNLLLVDRHRPQSLLGYVAYRQERTNGTVFTGYFTPRLTRIVMPQGGAGLELARVAAVFFMVYIIVIIPINYWLLKRLKKQSWAWRVIPVCALIFALGSSCIGYALQGGELSVNRVAIVETSSGQRLAGIYQDIGLTAHRRMNSEIVLTTGSAAVAHRISPRLWRRRGTLAEVETPRTVHIVQSEAETRLRSAKLAMGETNTFDVQSALDLDGTVEGSLKRDNVRHTFIGSVTNHLPITLSNCAVYYDSHWTSLGDLKTGESAPIDAALLLGRPVHRFFIPIGEQDHDTRRADMANFIWSLGLASASTFAGAAPVGYQPSPNEALLIAWSDNTQIAGPKARVNDRELPTKDMTLLIVHIPVSER